MKQIFLTTLLIFISISNQSRDLRKPERLRRKDEFPEWMKPSQIIVYPGTLKTMKKYVKSNQIISVKVPGNNGAGKTWKLENDEEVKKHGIEPLNLNEDKSVNFTMYDDGGRGLNYEGIYDFRFKIEKKAEPEDVLFSLIYSAGYETPSDDNKKTFICQITP